MIKININKNNLELLISSYIANNPTRIVNTDNKIIGQVFIEELFVNITKSNTLHLQYKVIREVNYDDYKDKSIEYIDYILQDQEITHKRYKELEEELSIDRNVIANIINILKDL